MRIIYSLLILILTGPMPEKLPAQDNASYIYGKVITSSDEEYVGFMRWGKEELLWHDIFNSIKVPGKNTYRKKTEEQENSWWNDIDWKWSSVWEDKYRTTTHSFACFFGDIKAIDVLDGDRVDLEFKDGSVIKLQGGSNDIGAAVKLTDYELGLITFNWNRIKRIEFSEAGSRVKLPYTRVLYGTVHTRRNGEFEGFIKWDLDERTLDDVLDGDTDTGDESIKFEMIRSIAQHEHGSKVRLNSGEEIFMWGSNDVNRSNRGIAIYIDGVGSVEVPWSEFREVQFYNRTPKGPSYNSFPRPDGLRAEIETFEKGDYKGRISFDIDEMYEPEFLDGKDNNMEYQIPFRNIRTIVPRNNDFSVVTLKNGKELLLGDTQDVSYKNDGILVYLEKQKDPQYIAWKDIDIIHIK